jgi:predicted nucleic acid-binding protein
MSLVVDASVAIKWFIQEALHAEARRLLDEHDVLYAPDLIVSEVANIAWKKSILGEIGDVQAQEVVKAIRKGIPVLYSSIVLMDRSLDIAIRLNHPVYDCLYIACAETVGGYLITVDKKLCRAAHGTEFASIVRHLEDEVWTQLEIRLSKVDRVIRAAEALRKTENTIETAYPDDASGPLGMPPVEASQMRLQAPSRRQLLRYIDKLHCNERADLLALMWLGRGDGSDWRVLRTRALNSVDEGTGERLTTMPLLADHLQKGLERLRNQRWIGARGG